MTYFNLRKHDGQSEIELDDDPTEDAEDETAEEPAERTYGPIITGLLGPGRWLTGRFNLDTSIVVHGASLFSALYYGGWIAAGVITVWIFLVLLFIPREALERWTAAIERLGHGRKAAEPKPEERPRAAPEDVRAATIDWIRRQIGDTQGVHLRDLLQHAQQHGMFEGLDVTTLRGHLERWGIPVRTRVRVRGKGVTVGIYREDLEPLLTPPSPTASQEPPNSELHPT